MLKNYKFGTFDTVDFLVFCILKYFSTFNMNALSILSYSNFVFVFCFSSYLKLAR